MDNLWNDGVPKSVITEISSRMPYSGPQLQAPEHFVQSWSQSHLKMTWLKLGKR